MHQGFHRLLLVALLCVAVAGGSAVPSSARAYHTAKERLLDTTAYSLDAREFRLGLMKLGYGILDRLQLSTHTVPWLVGLVLEDFTTFGSPNIELKSTLFDRRRFALSASAAFIWGRVVSCTDLPCIDDGDFAGVDYLVFPINVTSSVRINPWISVHTGAQYTATDAVGDAEPVDTEVSGTAAVDMLQIYGMLEWRLSRVVALTLTVRWLPYVSNPVVRGELVVDENTGAIVNLQVDILDEHSYAIIPGAVFSWKRANLRLGVGYGTFFVEAFGLAVPPSVLGYVSPELDVFVRF